MSCPGAGKAGDDDRALDRDIVDLRVASEPVDDLEARRCAPHALREDGRLHELGRVLVGGNLVEDHPQPLSKVGRAEVLEPSAPGCRLQDGLLGEHHGMLLRLAQQASLILRQVR
jgi:hypothetical protein